MMFKTFQMAVIILLFNSKFVVYFLVFSNDRNTTIIIILFQDGINYAVRYIGYLEVNTSMKILDFDTR